MTVQVTYNASRHESTVSRSILSFLVALCVLRGGTSSRDNDIRKRRIYSVVRRFSPYHRYLFLFLSRHSLDDALLNHSKGRSYFLSISSVH